jgi:sugar O-acyltransferase (sialic acid O-acetyltransferase NeuD family)
MRLVLLGDSGHTYEIQELAEELGHLVVARLTTDDGLKELLELDYDGLVMAVGTPKVKEIFMQHIFELEKKDEFVTLISPYAKVSPTAHIGKGAVIQAGAVIMPNVHVGALALVNINTTIGHGAKIGILSTVNPGANISGDVTIGSTCLIGTGAQILEKLKIGELVIVGAGSVVTKDIPPNVTAVGIPARWER